MNPKSYLHNTLPKIVAVGIWIILNCFVFIWTYFSYKNDPEYYYLHQILGASLCTSRASANVVSLNFIFVVLSMCKVFNYAIREGIANILPGTFRRILDSYHNLHFMCSYSICILSQIFGRHDSTAENFEFVVVVVHTMAHFVNNYRFKRNFSTKFPALNIAKRQEDVHSFSMLLTAPGITGVLMLIILMLLLISSTANVRRDKYGIFWYMHHLAIPFTLLLLFHSHSSIIKRQTNTLKHKPGCHQLTNKSLEIRSTLQNAESGDCFEKPLFEDEPSQIWKWAIIPLAIFIFDRMVRSWRASRSAEVMKAAVHDNKVIELVLKKEEFNISPGQYVLLKCKGVSEHEWHPFTPSQCPTQGSGNISLHIKIVGRWTDRLSKTIAGTDVTNNTEENKSLSCVALDGPFASPFKDIPKFRVCICIAAGVGITPYAAIINDIRNHLLSRKAQIIYLVWSCRNFAPFCNFIEELHDLHKKLQEMNRPDALIVRFFQTGSKVSIEQGHQLDSHLYPAWHTSNSSSNPAMMYFHARMTVGRPSLSLLLEDFVRRHRRERIGVFYCGPKGISNTISNLCNRITAGGNLLIYHHDSF